MGKHLEYAHRKQIARKKLRKRAQNGQKITIPAKASKSAYTIKAKQGDKGRWGTSRICTYETNIIKGTSPKGPKWSWGLQYREKSNIGAYTRKAPLGDKGIGGKHLEYAHRGNS